MFLMPSVLLGVAIGLLLGGRLRWAGELRLRSLWLFFLALGLQLIAYPSPLFPLRAPADLATVLQLVSYGCLLAVTLLNLRVPGMAIAGAGMACNLAAIMANGLHMPALPEAMEAAGLTYTGQHNNSVAGGDPYLTWLVDRWAAPSWVPWGNVFSIGDVLLAVGVIVLVAGAMGASLPWRRAAAYYY